MFDNIKKYMSETLLFEQCKSKEEVINKLTLNIKIITGFCLGEYIYYFYSVIGKGVEENFNIIMSLTVCIVCGLRCLFLVKTLKKM